MWTRARGDEAGHDVPDYPDEDRDLGADRAYWRRRFFILCGGVVALGVCAWLFPGAHQPSKHDVAVMSASMAALAKRQALPPAATGPAATGPAWPGASSLPDLYPTAPANPGSATKKASPAKQVSTARPKPSASASPSGAKAGACKPSDIVLSLFTSQSSYHRGAHPKFSVYAVSTSATPCTLSYGAGSVQVVVTQHGHVVWDSAACGPAPAKPVRFTLGVPQALAVVWDPTAAKPAGCAGSLPAGASATLNAVATSHGRSSPVRTFKVDW